MNQVIKIFILIFISLKCFGQQQDPPLIKISEGGFIKFEQYLFSALNTDSTKKTVDSLCCSIDVFAKFSVKKGLISPISYSETTPMLLQTIVTKLILSTSSYWKEIEDSKYLLPLSFNIASVNCIDSNLSKVAKSDDLINHRAFWSIQSSQENIDEKAIWLMKNERFKGVILHPVRMLKVCKNCSK